MTVFVVVSEQANTALEQKIAAAFPQEDYLKIADNQWLVSSDVTARQLCDKISVTGDAASIRQVAAFSISNYYGRHDPEIWEWLKVKMEKSS